MKLLTMRKLFLYPSALCLLITLATITSSAQQIKTIVVHVLDPAQSKAIEGATVRLTGDINMERTTGYDGSATFKFKATPGLKEVKLEVSYGTIGFRKYLPFYKIIQISSDNSYSITAPLISGEVRFQVKVIEENTGMALPFATVIIRTSEGVFKGETDASGNTIIDIEQTTKAGNVSIEASKNGYEPSQYGLTMVRDTRSYQASLSLSLKAGAKLLRVFVADEKGKAIQDASVAAQVEGMMNLAKGVTDATGMTTLVCEGTGKYSVKVTHSNFLPLEKDIFIDKYSDQNEYGLAIDLKKKTGDEEAYLRPLTVTVLNMKTKKPVSNATVFIENHDATTSTSGVVHFPNAYAFGSTGHVKVSAKGYNDGEITFTAGGEKYKVSPSREDEVTIYINKTRPDQIFLMIEVMDYESNRPIRNAAVTVSNRSNKVIMSGKPTNIRGDTKAAISGEELDNAPFHVKASADKYEPNRSDITADFLNLPNDTIVFTIFLRPTSGTAKKGEHIYGPFGVNSGKWAPTGIYFKKGDYFRVEAKGYFTAKDGSHIGPEGGGYWMWWTLAGQIGSQRYSLSKSGGGEVTQDGYLELGTPRGLGSKEFVKEDVENLAGELEVYVYSTGGTQADKKLYDQASTDLNWLKRIRDNDRTAIRPNEPNFVKQQMRYIISKYHLQEQTLTVDIGDYYCSDIVDLRFKSHNDSPLWISSATNCLNNLIGQLEKMIAEKNIRF